MAAFAELGLAPELCGACEALGWGLPTSVQAEAVPLVLGGGDVMAAAETGSGKTGAFALPALQLAHEGLRQEAAGRAAGAGGGGGGGGRGAGGGAEPVGLSLEDRDPTVALSAEGGAERALCQSRAPKAWAGVRADAGALGGGRVWFEVECQDEGLCRVGWSTSAARLELGTCSQGFGYGGTAKKSCNKQFADYGEKYGKGDVVGCGLDIGSGEVAFWLNGRPQGEAFRLPKTLRGPMFPAVCLKNAQVAVNFGGRPWRHPPPTGFAGLAQAKGLVRPGAAEAEPTGGAGGECARTPRVLILEPTRDLARQTHECILQFAKQLHSPKIRAALLVGGENSKQQQRQLEGGVDVVTGTLAQTMHFLRNGKLSPRNLTFFILDEADRLLDDGNKDDILKIFGRMPKGGAGEHRLQVLLFSATLHSDNVQTLSRQLCQNPTLVDLKGKEAVPETVHHCLVKLDPKDDKSWLQRRPEVTTDGCHLFDEDLRPHSASREAMSEAVKRLKPRMLQRVIDAFEMEQVLVFCRTNFDCDNVERFLNGLADGVGGSFRGKRESGKEHPYSCVVLAGARSTEERRRALEAFKEGDVRILVCTDVAARGIDVRGLPYVINMTLPDADQIEDYIHRVGRVGRADTMGLAISLVSTVPEKVWYCTKKGYKPWFSPSKENVKTHQEGGHTKWYDEGALLKRIEKRLKQSVQPLHPDLSLPASIQGKAQYGQNSKDKVNEEAAERVAALKPTVTALNELEVQAQHSYLSLRTMWA